jgi:hypothetical protein
MLAVRERDCGATAWASTVISQGSHCLDRGSNLQGFYKAFFSYRIF